MKALRYDEEDTSDAPTVIAGGPEELPDLSDLFPFGPAKRRPAKEREPSLAPQPAEAASSDAEPEPEPEPEPTHRPEPETGEADGVSHLPMAGFVVFGLCVLVLVAGALLYV